MSGFLNVPKVSKDSQMKFPSPGPLMQVWDNSRRMNSGTSTVPSVVGKAYRVCPEDWAVLGAVRRPDFILQQTCRTKISPKGCEISGYSS